MLTVLLPENDRSPALRDLLAPLWSGDKKRVLNAIHSAFQRDDVEQGSTLVHEKAKNMR